MTADGAQALSGLTEIVAVLGKEIGMCGAIVPFFTIAASLIE